MIISKTLRCYAALTALLLAGVFFTGCKSDAPKANALGSEPALEGAPSGPPPAIGSLTTELYRSGDSIIVLFSDIPVGNPAFEEKIKDDGTITLLLNQQFKAAGKTRTELEKEIRERYVPRYYKYLTVTVKPRDSTLFYYVGGEVKRPDRQVYISRLTLTKAIQTAGDFTDFAKKSAVRLTRVDGSAITVNCKKVLDGKGTDPEIFPGDKIWVPRRVF